jgi:hypothetical protein
MNEEDEVPVIRAHNCHLQQKTFWVKSTKKLDQQ